MTVTALRAIIVVASVTASLAGCISVVKSVRPDSELGRWTEPYVGRTVWINKVIDLNRYDPYADVIPVRTQVTITGFSTYLGVLYVSLEGSGHKHKLPVMDVDTTSTEKIDEFMRTAFRAEDPETTFERWVAEGALSPEHADSLRRGTILPGMTDAMVIWAHGQPTNRDVEVSSAFGRLETWRYWSKRERKVWLIVRIHDGVVDYASW
jgi:hypothetical protein